MVVVTFVGFRPTSLLQCFERLQTVANACQVPHFRNVHAVAVAITAGDPTKNVAALEQEAKLSPRSKFENNLWSIYTTTNV